MKDNRGNEVIPGCKLRSDLFGKDAPTITYEGGDIFRAPGGGTHRLDETKLPTTHWVVVEYPNPEKLEEKKA